MFDNVFRLNPIYSITPFEELSEAQKKRFKGKEFYALLHAPREAKLTVKAVNQKLALFLSHLREPKKLSEIFQKFDKGTKEEKEQFTIQLVLDCVLDVKSDDGFISGVEAVNRVLLPSPHAVHFADQKGRKTHTQTVSDRALYFAFNSALTQPIKISFLLYNFNRVPMNHRWKQIIPDEGALCKYLDLREDGSWTKMPEWIAPQKIRLDQKGQPNVFDLYWRSWNLKNREISKDMPSYKVYFSPLPRYLPDVFRIVRGEAANSEAFFMKVGRNLTGILRADKLIVYFARFDLAFDFARRMSETLAHFESQATPFSFQVHPESSLVSMGVDPPRILGERYSWRLYMTSKLSLAIQGARRTKAKDPRGYVNTYMGMLGIDTIDWRPAREDWSVEFEIQRQKDE